MRLDAEDERAVRLLRWLIAALLVVGAVAFVTEGADGPADPVLAGEGCRGRVELDGVAFGQAGVRITSADGDEETGCVFVAETPEQRGHGLMRVEDLGRHIGMVFVFESDTSSAFYMRNTPMPLSIAWFRADGTFVSTRDMEPCQTDFRCPTYGPTGPYRYALEVPKGDLDDLGVGKGSRLELLTPEAED
jgi:uncharacterized membrane protein (UPF0127 family)